MSEELIRKLAYKDTTELLNENNLNLLDIIECLHHDLNAANVTINELSNKIVSFYNENKKLLELCMYALISSTKIYNHELASDTKKLFINIIKANINDDTHTLRAKIEKSWKNI